MKFIVIPEHEIVEAARVARTKSRKDASQYIKEKYPNVKTASGLTVAQLIDNGLKIFLTYGHNAYYGKPEGFFGDKNEA